jgi:hypothetical protein
MRRALTVFGVLALTPILSALPAAAIKKVPYPVIEVRALPVFKSDPGLDAARKTFAEAVAAKNLDAVTALVASNFDWTAGGARVDDFDAKRGAAHNFRVAFGFRAPGREADGPTDIGPQWEMLEYFAKDPVLTQEAGSPFVCGSTVAKPADLAALEDSLNRVDDRDELSEWVYFVDEIALAASPGGNNTVTKVKNRAMPIVSVHPAPPAGDKPTGPVAPTHFELLLPDGRTGWAPVEQARPLFVDRLCFAKTGNDWKIALYDQSE